MSLDQDLMEVEPILRGTDGTFQFTHPSFQEVLTAKQFADEINSGELSVRDAYVNFWSYEEEAEVWKLPQQRHWRALLPSWYNTIINLGQNLRDGKFIQLLDVLAENYFACKNEFKEQKREESYNPFHADLVLAGKCLQKSQMKSSDIFDKIINEYSEIASSLAYSVNRWDNSPHELVRELVQILGDIGNDRAEKFLLNLINNPPVEEAITKSFGDEIPAYSESLKESAICSLLALAKPKNIDIVIDFLYRQNRVMLKYFEDYQKEYGNDIYKELKRNMTYNCRKSVPHLIRYIDKKAVHKAIAIRLLGVIGGEQALNYLTSCLADKQDSYKRHVLLAIGDIGSKKVIPLLIAYGHKKGNPERKLAQRTVIYLSANQEELQREFRAKYYSKSLNISLNAGIEEILDKFKRVIESDKGDFDVGEMREVIDFLFESKNDKARDYLFSHLESHNYYSSDIFNSLIGHADNNIISRLINLIETKSIENGTGFRLLSDIGGDRIQDYFIEYLGKCGRYEKRHALMGLVRIGGHKADKVITNFLQKEVSTTTWEVLTALTRSDARVIVPLRIVLSDHLSDSVSYDTVHRIHQRLKPRGYNPPVKKLVA